MATTFVFTMLGKGLLWVVIYLSQKNCFTVSMNTGVIIHNATSKEVFGLCKIGDNIVVPISKVLSSI